MTDTAPRACGDCGLCCKLLGVASIDKQPHRWCSRFRPGAGCLAYAERPAECVAFSCQWLSWMNLGEEWRPDRARFVLHLEDGGRRLCVEVDPAAPNAWRREPFHSALLGWSRGGAGKGLDLVIWTGQRGIALSGGVERPLPDRRPALATA